MTVSSREREQFRDQGYLIAPGLIRGEALKELDAMANRLLDGELQPEIPYHGFLPDHLYTFWEPGLKDRIDLPRPQRVRLMSNMCHHHPYFKELVRHPAIHEVVAGLYESGVRVFSDTLFMKPARHGIEAAPHQDTAFWPKLKPSAMNFWMAIDAATVENGCLHVIPGTHRSHLPHHDDPVQGHMLYEHEVDVSRQIPIELEPGGAIFFDSGLIHRSYPNRSDRSRRAYAVIYGAGHMRHIEPWQVKSIAEKTPQYEFELIEVN